MQAAQHLAPAPATPSGLHGQAPLHALLGALAGETADLAACADQLQVLFGQLMAEPPVRPGDALERAQTLDGLVQRLQGLNTFLAELGSRSLEDLATETARAASTLRLTSQASRFSAGSAARLYDEDAGDCHLF